MPTRLTASRKQQEQRSIRPSTFTNAMSGRAIHGGGEGAGESRERMIGQEDKSGKGEGGEGVTEARRGGGGSVRAPVIERAPEKVFDLREPLCISAANQPPRPEP
eukprot:753414-Hanusia_phi.AAC.5